jgi:hypothetical protein
MFAVAIFCWQGGQAEIAAAQIKSEELPNREGLVIEDYFVLHQQLKTDLVWDSNVFLTDRPEAEKDALIFTLIPTSGIEVPMGDNIFSFEYEPSFVFYSNYPQQDHIDHRLRGLLEVYWTDYKLTLDDVYERWTNIPGQDELGTTGRRTRQDQNNLELSVEAEFDQLEYRAAYTNLYNRYLSKATPLYQAMQYDDRTHMYNEGDLEVGYRLFPKTIILFEGIFGHVYYPSDFVPSSYYFETLLGFKGEWFDKLTFNVRGGLKYQDYGDSDLVLNEDYVDFVARGGVDYEMTENDIARLNFSRQNYDTIYRDMNYYTRDAISLDYTHRFAPNLSTNMFFAWQQTYYPHTSTVNGVTAKRRDHLYRFGPSVRYDVNKWVSLETGYEYRHRNSRFKTFDYDDHRITLSVTAGF